VAELAKEKSEGELWNELMQAQQHYAQSLARLDALIFDSPTGAVPLVSRLLEETADTRRMAYARYRRAMDEFHGYLRK